MTSEVPTIWTDFHKKLKVCILNKTQNPTDTDETLQKYLLMRKIKRKVGKRKTERAFSAMLCLQI